jgi:hypothetical protein
MLPPDVSEGTARVPPPDRRLRLSGGGNERGDAVVLTSVKRAIAERRELRFVYRSAFESNIVRRQRVDHLPRRWQRCSARLRTVWLRLTALIAIQETAKE